MFAVNKTSLMTYNSTRDTDRYVTLIFFAVWLSFKFLIAVFLILFLFPDARNGDFKNLGRAHITWAPWKCCRSTSVTYRLITNWIYDKKHNHSWCLLQPLRSNIVNKLICPVLQKWGFAVQILNVTQTEIQYADCLCFSPYHPFFANGQLKITHFELWECIKNLLIIK